MEIFDLRYPQVSLMKFSVPDFTRDATQNLPAAMAQLKHALRSPHKNYHILLWSNVNAALAAFVQQHVPKANGRALRVLTWLPAAIPADQANVEWLALPRDASDWSAELLAQADLLWLPNPLIWDGYYLPQEFLTRSLQTLADLAPRLPLVIDQRGLAFGWEDPSPSDLLGQTFAQPYLILGSTHPMFAASVPHEIVWTWSETALPQSPDATRDFATSGVQTAHYLIASYKMRQGPFAQMFHKQMLVVQESLKRLAGALQSVAVAEGFRVSHWPASGLYLCLDTPSEIEARRLQSRWNAQGIVVQNGTPYGRPQTLILSYAMHLSQNDRLLRRLGELNRTVVNEHQPE